MQLVLLKVFITLFNQNQLIVNICNKHFLFQIASEAMLSSMRRLIISRPLFISFESET